MLLNLLSSLFLFAPPDDLGGGGGGGVSDPGGGDDGDVDPPAPEPKPASSGPTAAQLEAERKRAEKAEREAAKLRKEAEDRRKAEMSDLEKAQAEAEQARAEAAAARAEAREMRLANSIREQLADAGLANPDGIVIAGIRSSLEVDDETGEATNLAETVEAFKGRYGSLFAGDGGNPGASEPKPKATSSPKSGNGKESDRGTPDGELTDEERAKAVRARVNGGNTRI